MFRYFKPELMSNKKEVRQMIGTNISFTREKNGYDREQVDSYIKKVSEAYQSTYYEYLDLNNKYNNLLEDREARDEREKTSSQEKPGMNSEIAAKTLINTELLAQKIIADAQDEAAGIMEQAQKSMTEAKTEAAEIRVEAARIINDAYAEAAEIKIAAQKILDDANAEAEMKAEQITRDIEAARKIMARAANEVEGLLTQRESEVVHVAAA